MAVRDQNFVLVLVFVKNNILWPHLYHHSGIAPFASSVTGRHAVDHNLLPVSSCGDNHSSGTHAERINASAIYLCHKRILSSRQVLSPTLRRMILYLVDELRRMFQPYTYGNTLRLNQLTRIAHALKVFRLGHSSQIAIHIPCRMARSKHYSIAAERQRCVGTFRKVNTFHAFHLIIIYKEACHLGLEMHLATRGYNLVAHVLNHSRQFVRADVRMGISQDAGTCTKLAEHIEYLLRIAALLAASI